jgi:putative membrane protein
MQRKILSTLVAAGMALAPAMLAQSSQQKDREGRTGAAQGARSGQAASTDSHDAQHSATQADRTSAGTAGAGTASGISGKDKKFIMDAAQDGMVEVELGQLAQQKASSPDVKSFGQKMVEQHTKANEELKTIASAHNVTLPTDLEAKQRTNIDRLSKLEGEQFDKAYMQYMVQDHKKAVSLFDKTSKSAKNDDVKQFAAKTLPALREHLQSAQTVNSSVSSTGTASRQKSDSSSGATSGRGEHGDASSDAGRTGSRGQSGSTSGSGRTDSQSQRNPDTTRQP